MILTKYNVNKFGCKQPNVLKVQRRSASALRFELDYWEILSQGLKHVYLTNTGTRSKLVQTQSPQTGCKVRITLFLSTVVLVGST